MNESDRSAGVPEGAEPLIVELIADMLKAAEDCCSGKFRCDDCADIHRWATSLQTLVPRPAPQAETAELIAAVDKAQDCLSPPPSPAPQLDPPSSVGLPPFRADALSHVAPSGEESGQSVVVTSCSSRTMAGGVGLSAPSGAPDYFYAMRPTTQASAVGGPFDPSAPRPSPAPRDPQE